MSVFDRFERRLERLVEGAFAKVFKGEVQPVEIAGALQRETDGKRMVMGQGRTVVPNGFVVELGDADYERLSPYADPLGDALAEMVEEHAQEQHYSFLGPVRVHFVHEASLGVGQFRVRSDPAAAPAVKGGSITREPLPSAIGTEQRVPRHRLVIVANGGATDSEPAALGEEVSVPVDQPVTIIGRSAQATVRLDDPGVSRRHAELHLADDIVRLVDTGSTNGTTVNGIPVTATQLSSGDRIQVGNTLLVYRCTA